MTFDAIAADDTFAADGSTTLDAIDTSGFFGGYLKYQLLQASLSPSAAIESNVIMSSAAVAIQVRRLWNCRMANYVLRKL